MHRLDIPHSLTGVRRKIRQVLNAETQVDRPVTEVLRPEFLAGLKRLDLMANVLVKGFLQGLHRTPLRGFSSEFSEYRVFSAGDDFRWIDWRLYARTDRLFVKRFEAESALRATLVVDASASMGYCSPTAMDGSGEGPVFSKLGYGVVLAAALAYLLQQQRDRVGLYCFGGQEGAGTLLQPRSSRNHIQRVVQVLSGLKAGGEASLPVALSAMATREKRRGLVIIFSDALCGWAQLGDALQRLRHRGHDVIFFQIWDPAELNPPVIPGTAFRDPESGGRYQPLPGNEYNRRSQTHLAEVRKVCLASGCEHQFMLNSSAFDLALIKFLQIRKRKQ